MDGEGGILLRKVEIGLLRINREARLPADVPLCGTQAGLPLENKNGGQGCHTPGQAVHYVGMKRSAANKRRYVLFYKPYGVLSQFTRETGRETLQSFGPFPRDIYPVGRLDADSEGLLFLTNDNEAKHRLTEPRFGHSRTYLVQIEHVPAEDALERLRLGMAMQGRKTSPALVKRLAGEPDLPPRPVPIRLRKSIPTAWLEITLFEGRNRQVRRMTAAVGHPTLRLVRVAMGSLNIKGLLPGESRHLTAKEIRVLMNDLKRIRE